MVRGRGGCKQEDPSPCAGYCLKASLRVIYCHSGDWRAEENVDIVLKLGTEYWVCDGNIRTQ